MNANAMLYHLFLIRNMNSDEVLRRGTEEERMALSHFALLVDQVGRTFNQTATLGSEIARVFGGK